MADATGPSCLWGARARGHLPPVRAIFRSHADAGGSPPAARPRCPRCGASLGALEPGGDGRAASWYCGCCGLVTGAAAPTAGAPGGESTPPGVG